MSTGEYPDLVWWQARALDHYTDAEKLMTEIGSGIPLPSRIDDIERDMRLASIHALLAEAATQQQTVLMRMRELREAREARDGTSETLQEDTTE